MRKKYKGGAYVAMPTVALHDGAFLELGAFAVAVVVDGGGAG